MSGAGDEITIFSECRSMKEAVALLRALPKPSEPEQHESMDVPDRA